MGFMGFMVFIGFMGPVGALILPDLFGEGKYLSKFLSSCFLISDIMT